MTNALTEDLRRSRSCDAILGQNVSDSIGVLKGSHGTSRRIVQQLHNGSTGTCGVRLGLCDAVANLAMTCSRSGTSMREFRLPALIPSVEVFRSSFPSLSILTLAHLRCLSCSTKYRRSFILQRTLTWPSFNS